VEQYVEDKGGENAVFGIPPPGAGALKLRWLVTVGCLVLATGAWGQSPEWSRSLGSLGYELYQVRAGDTVENIASRFGVSPQQIRSLNALPGGAQVSPGQSLAVMCSGRVDAEQAADTGAGEGSLREFEPQYGLVTASSPILSQCPPIPGAIHFEPAAGSSVIVTCEQGTHFGVVMIDGSTGWISKSAARLTGEAVPPAQLEAMLRGGRPDIVQHALQYLGTPYRYGGALPDDVDCSLLMQVVFAAHGISLPRTAAGQFEVGRPVDYPNLLPGDRLYFISKAGRINHTGIYIGAGQFVHASSRRGCVVADALTESTFWRRFVGARRS